MKRLFSKKQRNALALWSLGKCTNCGINLPAQFHADHRIPFSKGGKTDVINGQALCPSCNLKKGNKMEPVLRNWQQRSNLSCIETFKKGSDFFLMQATPGGGKTIAALSIFSDMRSSGLADKVIILAPSTQLVTQWRDDAKNYYNLELSANILSNYMPDFHLYAGMIMTYQGMNESHETLRLFCGDNKTLVIADEMHHISDGQAWGDAFRNAFEPSAHILGLTGTPWGSNGKSIPYVQYDGSGYAKTDFSYSKKRAIADKVCRVTEFHPMRPQNLRFFNEGTGEVVGEYETIEAAKADNIPKAYLKTLQNLRHMKSMFLQADEQLSMLRSNGVNDAGGLIVAPDIRTAHKFKDEIYMLTGEDFTIVHSKAEKPQVKINEYRNSSERWLISVDMVTEGVDIKRLQVCVFLSTKNTELFLRQVIGRIERIRNKDSDIDGTGYFYYTDTPELSDLIKKLEDENQAGLELLTCDDCGENPCICEGDDDGEGGGGDKETDNILLANVETEQQGLIAKGYHFNKDTVIQAIKRKRSNDILLDVPLYIICKVVVAEASAQKEEAYEERTHDIPLDVKKERLRSRIAKEINRKMAVFLNGMPSGDNIRTAHKNINSSIGLPVTDSSTSLEKLEDKLEYITNTKAEYWL